MFRALQYVPDRTWEVVLLRPSSWEAPSSVTTQAKKQRLDQVQTRWCYTKRIYLEVARLVQHLKSSPPNSPLAKAGRGRQTMAKSSLLSIFVNSFIETWPRPLIYILSMAAFLWQQRPDWILAMEEGWPTKFKIVITSSLQRKFATLDWVLERRPSHP